MPGNSTFRTKLIGLTLVPTVALAGVTALAVRPRLADATNASKDLLTIDAVQRTTNYLVELGEERQITVRYLLAKKLNPEIGKELSAQRKRTDIATAAFKEAVNLLPEERRTSTVPDAYKTIESLETIRRSVDSLNQAPAYTLSSFNSEADTLLDFYHDATDASSQSQQIRDGASLANLTVTRELWARGRDLLTISLETKTFDAKALSQFVALNDQADRARRTFNATASPRLVEKVGAELKVPAVSATQDLVIAAINAGQRGAVPNVNADTWFKGSSGRVKVLTDTVGPLFANLRERAAALESDARSAALLFVILGLVAIGLALGFSIILGRSLVRRLASVSAQAKEIAEQRLPEVLHILRTPSAEALATAMPEVTAGVNDEVGQIATSFNTVLRTAVRTSLEHANKRAKTMNDMLVNLVRSAGRREVDALVPLCKQHREFVNLVRDLQCHTWNDKARHEDASIIN